MANVGFWQQDMGWIWRLGEMEIGGPILQISESETLQFYGCPSGLPESAHAFDFGSHLLLKHVATIGYTVFKQ